MFPDTSNMQKTIRLTETASEPLHVPLIYCNENFLVSQVDVRRYEDIRHIAIHKILDNGDLLPLREPDPNFQQTLLTAFETMQRIVPNMCFNNLTLRDFILRLIQQRLYVTQQLLQIQQMVHEQQLLQSMLQQQQQQQLQQQQQQYQQQLMQQQYQLPRAPQTPLLQLDSSQIPVAAAPPPYQWSVPPNQYPLVQQQQRSPLVFEQPVPQLRQQLQWNNQYESKRFPFHHTQATSTTEIKSRFAAELARLKEQSLREQQNNNFSNCPNISSNTIGVNTIAPEHRTPYSVSVGTVTQNPFQGGTLATTQTQTPQPHLPDCSAMKTQTSRLFGQMSAEVQTPQPVYRNIDAQTPRIHMVQAQTSCYKMPPAAPRRTAITPMAAPMTATGPRTYMPLGITNN